MLATRGAPVAVSAAAGVMTVMRAASSATPTWRARARNCDFIEYLSAPGGSSDLQRLYRPKKAQHLLRTSKRGQKTPARLRRGGLELAAELLDLVPELGGVLEAELLGGREHL